MILEMASDTLLTWTTDLFIEMRLTWIIETTRVGQPPDAFVTIGKSRRGKDDPDGRNDRRAAVPRGFAFLEGHRKR